MAELKEALRPKTQAAKGQNQSTEIERHSTGSGNGNSVVSMRRFAEEMDRLFDDFGLSLPSFLGRGRELFRREVGLIPAAWSPRVDIRERDGLILIRADLPGLSKDDIQVDLTDERLTIRGERKQEQKEEHSGYCYSECSYGRFYRAIPVPEGVDASKVTAEFRNGVLEIAMPAPRRPEPKARRVEIQEKK
jgi:HSP20 family protein